MTLDPQGSELHPLVGHTLSRDGRRGVVDGVVGDLARVRYTDEAEPGREWIPLAEAEANAEPKDEWPFNPLLYLVGALAVAGVFVLLGVAASTLSH